MRFQNIRTKKWLNGQQYKTSSQRGILKSDVRGPLSPSPRRALDPKHRKRLHNNNNEAVNYQKLSGGRFQNSAGDKIVHLSALGALHDTDVTNLLTLAIADCVRFRDFRTARGDIENWYLAAVPMPAPYVGREIVYNNAGAAAAAAGPELTKNTVGLDRSVLIIKAHLGKPPSVYNMFPAAQR